MDPAALRTADGGAHMQVTAAQRHTDDLKPVKHSDNATLRRHRQRK